MKAAATKAKLCAAIAANSNEDVSSGLSNPSAR